MKLPVLVVTFVGLLPLSAQQQEAAADAPQVVSLTPADRGEVDAAKSTQLVVVFDRAMNTGGFSICGGGPDFPKLNGRPRWQDTKTLVVDVALVPDHRYVMSLNGPGASNFRSADGVALAPVPWTFVTLPTELRPAQEQRARNERGLELLLDTLRERYSYYDRRVQDWARLRHDHREAVLAARSDRGFAAAAAHMLRATEDLHLYLKVGDDVFAAGTRAVDSLWRRPRIERYVRLAAVGKNALAGRTEDGIGYLMVAAWNDDVDLAAIDQVMAGFADTAALVIDARPNSGGDESLAQQVAGWFVTGTKGYAKDRFRKEAGPDGFTRWIERQVIGHGEARHYGKPIAVLTSRYVMSSNESFVLRLRQADDCVVVGQTTFGSSGNPVPHDLGNGVIAMVPSWQDATLDGVVFEGKGLAPDHVVECTAADLMQKDPILERALELLRARR